MATAAKLVYPHVTQDPDVRGGQPCLDHTRLRVATVVYLHKQGKSPEDIVETYDYLSLAQVHGALVYYYDHPREIEAALAAEDGWEDRHERRKAEFLSR